ncbi:hypothetical protein [Pengzhenrongella phosphoraccumulans]|uniref:primosomal protein N' family DNA-binding protein n=1 Tax=Pengzhenrongella phosphoraccumulans TaxID=3114394 RepID=UPI00388F909E
MTATDLPDGVQLTLAGLPGPRAARRPRSAVAVEIAERLPVARVCIDLPPAHLDRPFEYLVPAALDDVALPGTRVKVRFGRQDVDGFLLERVETAEHDGELVPLRKVVSGEVVLTPAVRRLARAVADRYAGTLADVLRLAIPPRHARVEAEASLGGPAGGVGAGARASSLVERLWRRPEQRCSPGRRRRARPGWTTAAARRFSRT